MAKSVPTKWAQREDKLYLTFENTSCTDWTVDFEANKVIFKGTAGKVSYENTLELFDEIQTGTKENTANKRGLGIECTVMKKTNSWWPRLLSQKIKHHWLKVDFKKWKDEDDSEVEEDWGAGDADGGMGGMGGQPDLAQMMQQMGGGAAMGTDTMGGLSESDDDDIDSDDEDIPGLENDAESTPAVQELPPVDEKVTS